MKEPLTVDSVRALDCPCIGWASEDHMSALLGNGHHLRCEHFKPNTGALEIMAHLCAGIENWASQGDGIPEDLWESYSRAKFITTGKFPDGKRI